MSKFNFEALQIEPNLVSILASGPSILKLTKEDFDLLKLKSFLVTTNFPICLHIPSFAPHLHIWSDELTSTFMEQHQQGKIKDCLWCSRPDAFNEAQKSYSIYHRVDYWYDKVHYKLEAQFTFFWVLQLIRRFFPNKKVLIFGLDGYIPDNTPCEENNPFMKWYDFYIKDDRKDRDFKVAKETLDMFVNDIEGRCKKDVDFSNNIYNCNLESRVRYIKKINFKEFLNGC